MATCLTNEDNRIIRWTDGDQEPDELLNPEYIDENYTGDMNDFLYDPETKTVSYSPPQAVANAREVARLKQSLVDTDWIACKIAEGAATAEEYAEQIARRAAWRARINELENETQPVQESL